MYTKLKNMFNKAIKKVLAYFIKIFLIAGGFMVCGLCCFVIQYRKMW